MIAFLADENVQGPLIRGIRDRHPEIDLARAQDVGLMQTDDPIILEWAAENNRVLLTHDAKTMTKYAYDRVKRGLRMPGIVEINSGAPNALVIEDIAILATCGYPNEWEGRVMFVPLQSSSAQDLD